MTCWCRLAGAYPAGGGVDQVLHGAEAAVHHHRQLLLLHLHFLSAGSIADCMLRIDGDHRNPVQRAQIAHGN